jgi:beta-fructofuranosidase
VAFAIAEKYALLKAFLTTCLSLQSQTPQTRRDFPTSFVEHDGVLVADYGQRAIGQVISVDATLWWVVLANAYVKHSGVGIGRHNQNVQSGIQFLDLILRPSFREAPTLYVPDGAFMIDRPLDVWSAPLEIQALLYGALRSAAALLTFVGSHSQPHTPNDCLSYARVLRRHLLKHYWVTK